MSSPAALLVFAKLPEPGAVKTRLTTLLTHAEAAALSEAFLRDSLDAYGALPADVRLYVDAPPETVPSGLAPAGVSLHAQRGDDLGARMLNASVEAFVAGYERVVIIGADHPTLPTAFVRLAFEELAAPLRVVLGPSEDGGYYLIGMNEVYPTLFEGMTYGHGAVLAETLARAQAVAAVSVLPPWYDVDTPEALRRLSAELGRAGGAPERTREVVARLRLNHPSLT